MSLKKIAQEYNEFPQEFQKAKGKMLFVHKHGNLDNVMRGADLISRVQCEEMELGAVVKVKTTKQLPVGHVFLGIVGQKCIANAYVHESTKDYAIIGSMSSYVLS